MELLVKKKIFLQCSTQVDKNAVSRESIGGAEHIIISSFTLPDDIVMNGGLYPAEEIAASFQTLERTLAPLEHPTDSDGNFLSASDPIAIHNFHAGAFNTNVAQENGRIRIDKTVNVQEALKSDRGKRLLDRINELETSENPRPVHTSVGVFLEMEELENPVIQTNGPSKGQEFTWIARNMVFDHDAILLDSVGAAQPGQGVGMAVNKDGDKIDASSFVLNLDDAKPIPGPDELSHEEIEAALRAALREPPFSGGWPVRVFNDTFIFESGDDQLFSAPYIMEGGKAKIVGIPLPVERDETFTPKTNRENDAMNEFIVNALKAAGIETEGLDEATLFARYNELMADQHKGDGSGADTQAEVIANAVTAALEPVTNELASLKEKLNKSTADELDSLAKTVGESGLFPNLDTDSAKLLGVDKLMEMAANCPASHGIPAFNANSGEGDERFADASMPE